MSHDMVPMFVTVGLFVGVLVVALLSTGVERRDE